MFKLLKMNVSGKFYSIIKHMYSSSVTCVKLPQGLTSSFETNIGIRQGDSLSPLLFSLFIDDIKDIFEHEDEPCSIGNIKLSHLLYADDLILVSESRQGLQRCINKLSDYCDRWKLQINKVKTKILVFTPSGRIPQNLCKFYLGDCELETVLTYKYLGITISSNGMFGQGINELAQKGRKAWYALRRSVQIDLVNDPQVYFKLFDAMIKPILLYGAEIWGQDYFDIFAKYESTDAKFDGLPFELFHNQVCKQILGVSRLTTNLGARVELGRLPLSIQIVKSTLNYWLKLEKANDDSIVKQCFLSEKELCQRNIKSWFGVVNLMQQKHVGYEGDNVRTAPNKQTVIAMISELTKAYESQSIEGLAVGRKAGQGSKLRTYAKFKHSVTMGNYLLSNRLSWKQKSALSKFRLSDHHLRIEKGRHCRPRLPADKRICQYCNLQCVEDEIHFLLVCPQYADLRDKYLINHIHTDGIRENSFVNLMCIEEISVWCSIVGYLDEAFLRRSCTKQL